MSSGVSATAAEPDGRTPVNPPTQPFYDPWTTPGRHRTHTTAGACENGSPPPSGAPSPKSLIPTRSTSPRPTSSSHMRAGINFHRGPPASDVAYQHPIMEDPPSLLVDSNSPWQIPDSPLISEEPFFFQFGAGVCIRWFMGRGAGGWWLSARARCWLGGHLRG